MQGAAIIVAAGRGKRMGTDKALSDLDGRTMLQRIVDDCRVVGVDVVVVRRRSCGGAGVPGGTTLVLVEDDGEMIDSYRAGLAAVPAADFVLAWPVDYALSGSEVAASLILQMQAGAQLALPLARQRPGHPIALARPLFDELRDVGTNSLRDVVRRDPQRVVAVPVVNDWVCRDLDTPSDLARARAFLQSNSSDALELMRAHRSRRGFRPDKVPDWLVEELVEAAQHAPTSSFIQAYSVVAVTDPDIKKAAAELCANQPHIHQAPVFLAVCADLYKLRLACEDNDVTLRAGSVELFLQASVDAALVGQNLQLAAESRGLGSCMLGAARNHPVRLAALLNLPPHCFVLFGMVIGVAADDPVPRQRMPLPGVLHWQRYDEGVLPDALDAADQQMRDWAKATNRRGGYVGKPVNEQRGWRERMAWLWGRDRASRDQLVAQLRELGLPLNDLPPEPPMASD